MAKTGICEKREPGKAESENEQQQRRGARKQTMSVEKATERTMGWETIWRRNSRMCDSTKTGEEGATP